MTAPCACHLTLPTPKHRQIDSAAAATATKHTANVKRAYKHLGLKDVSDISVLPFPFLINPSETAQQLTRYIKASASDILMMYNGGSYEGLSSTDWIPGWEHPLQKSFARAITPDKPTTAPPHYLDGLFVWAGVTRT